MVGLPFLKLGSLLVKQIGKPLASRLRIEAGKRPKFANLCTKAGQWQHYISSRITVFANGYKFIGVKPLPEEEAQKNGIEFLSESIVLTVMAGIIIFEYDRGERKTAVKAAAAAAKERNQQKQVDSLEATVKELVSQVEEINIQLQVKPSIPNHSSYNQSKNP
jgi:hypothetical protein